MGRIMALATPCITLTIRPIRCHWVWLLVVPMHGHEYQQAATNFGDNVVIDRNFGAAYAL